MAFARDIGRRRDGRYPSTTYRFEPRIRDLIDALGDRLYLTHTGVLIKGVLILDWHARISEANGAVIAHLPGHQRQVPPVIFG